jgi:hypothetical protein
VPAWQVAALAAVEPNAMVVVATTAVAPRKILEDIIQIPLCSN